MTRTGREVKEPYYTIEQADRPPGVVLEGIRIDPSTPLRAEHRPGLLDGVTVLRTEGLVVAGETTTPYRRYDEPAATARPTPVTLIPYFA
ncbi:hypothetical protein AB0M95_37030 [Sphaerisporangium sp. NPDC051017]|uniref:hypothetical protein n=1 Tax=Sphaerisporangium sp. NPDC051017 TaxID=3154636 RepID=UPI0034444628